MKAWKTAVAVIVMLFGAICTQAQWYQKGGGEGPEFTSQAGNFAGVVSPDCNGGVICFPQWLYHITFPGVTVNSGHCGQVIDAYTTYRMSFCTEATKQTNGLWNTNIRVVYTNLSNNSYTELLNILVAQNQSSPAGQWIYFSENYYNRTTVRYDFKYSPDNVNWSAVHSWYEGQTGYPVEAGMLTYSPGTCQLTTVHIDGWVTYETPGRTTPNLLDSDITNSVCFGIHGAICDQDECASAGQTLYQNQ